MLENPWLIITFLGTPEIWLGIAGVLTAFYLLHHWKRREEKRLRRYLKVFLIAFAIVFVIVGVVKEGTAIPRPCNGLPDCEVGSSFPSGHAAIMFSVTVSTLLFLKRKWLPILIVPVLVSWSRIALGVHTMMDIVGGAILGTAVPLFVYWAVLKRQKE